MNNYNVEAMQSAKSFLIILPFAFKLICLIFSMYLIIHSVIKKEFSIKNKKIVFGIILGLIFLIPFEWIDIFGVIPGDSFMEWVVYYL